MAGPLARPQGTRLGPATVRFTGRAEGDLGPNAPNVHALQERRRAVVDLPWCCARQVHGATIAWLGAAIPTAAALPAPPDADAVLTNRGDHALAVFTADCAPIALSSPEEIIGAVHAGWRGLAAGVIEAAVDRLRQAGATTVLAAVGPCIHPCCYEFASAELDEVVGRYGPAVLGTTSWGKPALDLRAGVRQALWSSGAELIDEIEVCTGCSDRYFSHRTRQERERQAAIVWLQ